MWDLAVREDDYEAVDTMLARYSDAPLSYRIVPVYARRDTAAMSRVFEEARQLDARQSQIAGRYVAIHLDDFAAAERLARLDLQPRRNAAMRLGAQSFLAWLEVARGRWRDARAAFAAAERMEGGHTVRVERALAATLPFTVVPQDELRAIRTGVAAWNPRVDPGLSLAPPPPPLMIALRPHLRLYLLGLLSAKLGDLDGATAYAVQLEALDAPPATRRTIDGLVATIRADVALRRNRPSDALELLQTADGHVPFELVQLKAFAATREFTQEHARFLRAEALQRLGRDAEARQWLETSFQGSPLELVYLAPVKLRLAEVLRRQGDTVQAAAHQRSGELLWRDADSGAAYPERRPAPR